MTTVKIGITAATATLALAAGATAASAAAPAARPVLHLRTTSSHTVSTVPSTRPGVAALDNTSAAPIFLASPLAKAGKKDFAHDLNASTPAQLIKQFSVTDLLPGKAISYLRLSRGTYYLADANRTTFTAASITSLRVTGATVNAKSPAAHPVTVSSKNTISVPATTSTSAELRISNDSAHLQELLIFTVGKHVSAKALAAFIAKPSYAKLDTVQPSAVALLAILSPGRSVTSHRSAKAGRYLFLTTTVTGSTTTPILHAGQVRLLTVT